MNIITIPVEDATPVETGKAARPAPGKGKSVKSRCAKTIEDESDACATAIWKKKCIRDTRLPNNAH